MKEKAPLQYILDREFNDNNIYFRTFRTFRTFPYNNPNSEIYIYFILNTEFVGFTFGKGCPKCPNVLKPLNLNKKTLDVCCLRIVTYMVKICRCFGVIFFCPKSVLDCPRLS